MRISVFFLLTIIIACSNNQDQFTYNGRLDTDLIRLSTEIGGRIDSLNVDEGMSIYKGQLLAVINTDKLQAQKRQQMAQIAELVENKKALQSQILQVKVQLQLANQNLEKTKRMLANSAATEQRRDELQTRVDVFSAQLAMHQSNLEAIKHKRTQLENGLTITEITLEDARITSPIDGIVINRFRLESETIKSGTVLFEVADLSSMEAKIYIPLPELNKIKLGQKVEVLVDGVEQPFKGNVRWISSESEFTPKTILTQETRTTLVYRVKISITDENGQLKIGMPVDVRL